MATRRGGGLKLTDTVLITSASLTTEVTGILGVANGGTGQSTFIDGQLLIGNTTGNTLAKATLTQGTGVTITNGAGSITVAIGQAVATTSTPEFARLGIGGAADAADRLKITGGTVTADAQVFDAEITWNNSGVSFTAIRLNVTNTASQGGSLLMDLLVGGVSQFKVDRSGTVTTTTVNASSFMSVGSIPVLTETSTNTVTNKTLSGANNTFSAIPVTAINALNGFTGATPVRDDVFAFFDTSASANRDANLEAVLSVGLKGFVQGFVPRYSTTTQIQVTPGIIHLENGTILESTSTISNSPSLSANTWYYLYVYLNGSTTGIEVSTTAPASAYTGGARSKTSDTSRRYIGAFRTNGSSEIQNFWCEGSGDTLDYMWRLDVPALKRALGGGTATSKTAVSLSSLSATGGSGSTASGLPDSSGLVKAAILRLVNLSTNGAVLYMDNSEMTGTSAASTGGAGILQDADIVLPFPINDSREVRYAWNASPTGPGAYLDVLGFKLVR